MSGTQKAMAAFAEELDRREAKCLVFDKIVAAGGVLENDDKRLYDQWVAEGKPKWREDPKIIARVHAAARKAAKNAKRLRRKRP